MLCTLCPLPLLAADLDKRDLSITSEASRTPPAESEWEGADGGDDGPDVPPSSQDTNGGRGGQICAGVGGDAGMMVRCM